MRAQTRSLMCEAIFATVALANPMTTRFIKSTTISVVAPKGLETEGATPAGINSWAEIEIATIEEATSANLLGARAETQRPSVAGTRRIGWRSDQNLKERRRDPSPHPAKATVSVLKLAMIILMYLRL